MDDIARVAAALLVKPDAAWYLDQVDDAVDHPQAANDLVTELTGTPAQSVAQWAAANAEMFR